MDEDDAEVAATLEQVAKCVSHARGATSSKKAKKPRLDSLNSELAKFRKETSVDFLICPIKWWIYSSLSKNREDYPMMKQVARR
jgi:hypothetical protein